MRLGRLREMFGPGRAVPGPQPDGPHCRRLRSRLAGTASRTSAGARSTVAGR
jgi:hypothetical protein